jgi:hypothetical protein
LAGAILNRYCPKVDPAIKAVTRIPFSVLETFSADTVKNETPKEYYCI